MLLARAPFSENSIVALRVHFPLTPQAARCTRAAAQNDVPSSHLDWWSHSLPLVRLH